MPAVAVSPAEHFVSRVKNRALVDTVTLCHIVNLENKLQYGTSPLKPSHTEYCND